MNLFFNWFDNFWFLNWFALCMPTWICKYNQNFLYTYRTIFLQISPERLTCLNLWFRRAQRANFEANFFSIFIVSKSQGSQDIQTYFGIRKFEYKLPGSSIACLDAPPTFIFPYQLYTFRKALEKEIWHVEIECTLFYLFVTILFWLDENNFMLDLVNDK